ncbi:NFACT RNA binding domain-containing protein [Lacticaseibacillus brantae]|uniref:Rqc2 homolog RqcH n=1 Tax=Lacticaseibacillus brantae DSM 23927 TaxID=1423727 RepID=A0A0R2AZA8_9LACO|nr:NFACT RNA binding domain-containing protein [Lacticaseibacillus brantae]KRM72641.1 Fibronectin-binding protein [Lacticaseibacillus brantae DSM 23927]
MSFDGIFTHAMAQELNTAIVGARVQKIQQPYPNEIVLTMRKNRKNLPVLLSAHPQYARVQITDIPFANPDVPSKFTMTLRKYLAAASLERLVQVDNDRVLHLDFATRDELGDALSLRLVVEIMGRHSNITLVNLNNGKILDLIRHVPADQNRYRLLMPGATYVNPPAQDKQNPFTAPVPDGSVAASDLQQQFQGLAKDSATELANRLATSGSAGWHAFFAAVDQPDATITSGDSVSFTAVPYQSLAGEQQHYPTLSAMLDAFYAQKAERDRVQQQGYQLIRVLKNEIDKDKKKQVKLDQTLKASEKADDYRIKGEVLTTYLSQVTRGMTTITLPNFYADEAPLTISLSNQLSPSQNAQKYFAKYQKLRNSVAYVHEQTAKNQAELDYLEGIAAQIELANPKDIEDIRLELQDAGYLKKQKQGKKPAKRPKLAKPDHFFASDGTSIFVGKNNLQNDQLTLKTAKKTDIWLHAKDVPGSHVIIDSAAPSDKTLTEAAMLAAYFSKNRNGANVPVDYIEVKKIRKPNGAKPGFVVYEGQQTINVTPELAVVERLRHQPTM